MTLNFSIVIAYYCSKKYKAKKNTGIYEPDDERKLQELKLFANATTVVAAEDETVADF